MLTINIDNGNYLVVFNHRNNNLGTGLGAAGDMSFEFVHVVHHQGGTKLPGLAADSFTVSNASASQLSLEGPSTARPCPKVKAHPENPGRTLVRRDIGQIGYVIILVLDQTPQLRQQLFVDFFFGSGKGNQTMAHEWFILVVRPFLCRGDTNQSCCLLCGRAHPECRGRCLLLRPARR